MSRRRYKKSDPTKPFTLKLTDTEKAELTRRAGEMALGTYIKGVLFSDGDKRRARGARVPVKDHVKLAEVLACLGASHISESLQTLADAAETGTLRWDDDAPVVIKKACEDICVMRLLLMKALGFQIQHEAERLAEESVSQAFTRAAMDDEVSS